VDCVSRGLVHALFFMGSASNPQRVLCKETSMLRPSNNRAEAMYAVDVRQQAALVEFGGSESLQSTAIEI
jgi:hypothetical protein